MKMRHTPAPWEAATFGGRLEVIKDHCRTLAVIASDPTSEDQANARLIAAAPELLAMLKTLCGTFDSVEEYEGVRELIARAEGRTR